MGVNIIQNGIHFNVDTANYTTFNERKIVNNQNDDFSMNEANGDIPGDDVAPYVNAVEIDWNGAQIGES